MFVDQSLDTEAQRFALADEENLHVAKQFLVLLYHYDSTQILQLSSRRRGHLPASGSTAELHELTLLACRLLLYTRAHQRYVEVIAPSLQPPPPHK